MSYDTHFFTTLSLHDLEKIVARIRVDESEPLHSGYFLDYLRESDADWIAIIQDKLAFTPKNYVHTDTWDLFRREELAVERAD